VSFGLSAGGGQVRYAVVVTDQATQPLRTITNSFNQLATTSSTTSSKMAIMNNAFSASVNPIKNTGNAMNQLATTQKTLGSQLGTIGSAFKNNALAIGAAASSVLGLYQNYANLSSAQNNANKSATAAKAAQNNLAKAQDNLNKTISKYGANSKEAKAAQDKLTVAQERAVNKTESAKIAQDNLNQTMADFGINILPNIILAGGSITSIFDNIGKSGSGVTGIISKLGGGFKGLGSSLTGLGGSFATAGTGVTGLGGKLKDIGGSILGLDGPLKGLKGNLLGIGSIAAVGIVGLIGVMSDLSAKLKDLKDVSSGAITPIKAIGNEFDRWQNFDFTSIEGLASALVHGIGPGIPIMNQLSKGLKEVTSATIDQTNVAGFLAARQKDVADAQKNYNDMLGFGTAAQVDAAKAILDHANKNLELTKRVTSTAKATDTLDVAQKKYNATQKQTITLTENSSNTWALQAKAFDGSTTSINLATKAYLDVHNSIVANNPVLAKSIATQKEQNDIALQTAKALKNLPPTLEALAAAEEEYKTRVAAANNTLAAAADQTREYETENFKLIKTFGTLNKSTLDNSEVRDKLLAIQDKQINGFKEEEMNLLDVASANDVYSATIANLVSNEEDNVVQINELIAQSINYVSALDDQTKKQELVSAGFKDGIIQAKGFFDNLVKGTEQEGVFNAALADGAKVLGIHSNLLSFSNSTAQDLITTIYKTSKAYFSEAYAAASNTKSVIDLTKNTMLLDAASLSGIRSANDWAIGMAQSTEAAASEHDQLLALATQMGIVGNITKQTTEQLKIQISAAQGNTDAIKTMNDELKKVQDKRFELSAVFGVKDVNKQLEKLQKQFEKMLPNKVKKKIDLDLTLGNKEKAFQQLFEQAAGAATIMKDSDADKVASTLIKQIDKNFKGKSTSMTQLKAELKAAIADPNTPNALKTLLTGFDYGGIGIGKTIGTDVTTGVNGEITSTPPDPIEVTANIEKALDLIGEMKRGWDKVSDQISKKIPPIKVNPDQALDMIGELKRGWDKVAGQIQKKIPKITINANQALDIIGETKRGWDKAAGQIQSKVPKITVNANQALDMIGEVKRGMDSIKNKSVSINVGLSGAGASKFDSGETSSQKGDSSGIFVQGNKTNSGGGGGGDIIIETHNHIMNEDIMRRFKAQQGRDRYRFGLG
jgi:hypothetical protein